MDAPNATQAEIVTATETKKCGIIMPISSFPDELHYSAEHWSRVKAMIQRATRAAGYEAELVSSADVPTFIHASIIGNIFSHDIVICDVSGLNPNVLFELGLRLAAEKPVIIINDDKTRRIFDTGLIESYEYRIDLRYDNVLELEGKITKAITVFYSQLSEGIYQSFLSQIKIPNLKLGRPTEQDLNLAEYLQNISNKINDIERGGLERDDKQVLKALRLNGPSIQPILRYIKHNNYSLDQSYFYSNLNFYVDSIIAGLSSFFKYKNEIEKEQLQSAIRMVLEACYLWENNLL